jgi:hypothetical protein
MKKNTASPKEFAKALIIDGEAVMVIEPGDNPIHTIFSRDTEGAQKVLFMNFGWDVSEEELFSAGLFFSADPFSLREKLFYLILPGADAFQAIAWYSYLASVATPSVMAAVEELCSSHTAAVL